MFDEDSKHTSYFCTHRGPQGTREAKDSDSNIMMLRTFSKPSSSVFSSVSPRVSPKGLIDVGASIRTPPSQFQSHLLWLLRQNNVAFSVSSPSSPDSAISSSVTLALSWEFCSDFALRSCFNFFTVFSNFFTCTTNLFAKCFSSYFLRKM